MSNRSGLIQNIYNLVGEQHRGRSGQTGGLQQRGRGWGTIVRTTGEEELIGRDEKNTDLGGAMNRTVQINATVIDPAKAGELYKWMAHKHYGWGALRFFSKLSELVNLPDGQGQKLLLDRFLQIKDEIIKRSATSTTLPARSGQLAVVALAEYLANRWFFAADPAGALEGAISDAVAVAGVLHQRERGETLLERTVQLFHDHYIGRRALWLDLSKPEEERVLAEDRQRQLFGVITETEVWLIGREANEFLRAHGLPPRRIWNDLATEGWLKSQPSGAGWTVVRGHGRFRAKVYAVARMPYGHSGYDANHAANPFRASEHALAGKPNVLP
jgi:hypothetical protein